MSITKDEIRKKLINQIEDYERKINLWRSVEIVKKKDGSEFVNFGKNFTNAKIVKEWDNLYLTVSGFDNYYHPAYISDSINLRVVCQYWKGEKPAEERVIKEIGLLPYFYLNVEETYGEVKKIIEKYEGIVEEKKNELERLDEAYDYVVKVLDDLEVNLRRLCGCEDSALKNSLFYELQEKIHRFPY